MSTPALRSKNVTKSFKNGDTILTGTDLTVDAGEILLLMGPNGVGKTVLLSCFAGSEQPTTGSVEIFGTPATAGGTKQLSFMLQDSMLEEKLSGRENLNFYRGVQSRFTNRWESYVDRLGLANEFEKLVENYSEGMKRKLEFSLAMSSEVPLYLLDEPTAGVDLTNVQRFHDIILDEHDQGKTFVISSHRPIDINIADRIAFVPDGTVQTVGTPEILRQELPTVITVRGRETIEQVKPELLGAQFFPVGGEARGFLDEGTSIETIQESVGDSLVESTEPTHADLFNYYIHVEGKR